MVLTPCYKLYTMKNKTLRDELAMSMPHASIPTINDQDTMVKVAKLYNINFDFEDVLSMLDFAVQYEAAIRYKFADAMIKRRGQNPIIYNVSVLIDFLTT